MKVGANISDFQKNMNTVSSRIEKVGKGFTDVGKTLTAGVTVPMGLLGGASVKAASDFESAFAGVRKTVDASEKEFAALEQGIRNMAKEMPASAVEIAGVAEAAGQLGIKTENILDFTKTMINLGVATNMSSEEAAAALARLANITQMPQSEFDRLGSTVVELGNNLATTESEIVEMGLRLAGAGNQVGMTEAQILSFAGALSSVGIEAEAGGTAFSRVMLNMNTAVQKGGKELEGFAQVAGMSTQEFAKAFEEDAATAIIAFIEGLGKMSESGKDVTGVLADLGLNEIRVRDALLRASGAGDLFRESLELGTKAWEDNNALTKEAEERYKTFESRLQMFKNQLQDVLITLGGPLLDILSNAMTAAEPLIEALGNMASKFADLNPSIQTFIVGLAGLFAVLGPIITGIGLFIGAINNLLPVAAKAWTWFTNLSKTFTIFRTALTLLSGPIGLVIAAITALIAIGIAIWQNWETIREKAIEIWGAISEWIMSVAGPLVEWLQEKFTLAQEVITQIWEGIAEFFTAIWEIIKNIFLGALLLILDIFTGDFESMQSHAEQIFGNIQTALSDAWEAIKGIFNAALKWIVGLMGGDFESMRATVDEVWNRIESILSDVWEYIKNTFKNSLDFLKSLVTGDFEGMKEAIRNQMENVRKNLGSAWDKIKSLFTDAGQRIREIAREKFENMKRAVQDKMGETRDKIESLWQRAQNFLENINLASIGRDIIQGLINGITGMAGRVWKKAQEIADGVKNRIKDALKISSPSKVLEQYGEWTGEGFAIGIEKSIFDVMKSADRLASASISSVRGANTSNVTQYGQKEQKRPAIIQIMLGNQTFEAFVEDIEEVMDRRQRVVEGFR